MRQRGHGWFGVAMILATAACGRPPPAEPADGLLQRREPPLASPSAQSDAPAARLKIQLDAPAMGTHMSFVALTSPRCDEKATRAAVEAAMNEIRRLELLMTTWRDDSEVSRINRAAGKAPAPVSHETFEVIEKSLWMSEHSEGVFDITFDVMRGLWRFDENAVERVPAARDIARLRSLIGYRHVHTDREHATVFLDRAESRLSLGGIAKGYAIDRAAAILLAAGVDDFLAQAGGDLYVHGHKADGSPWVAGVRDPRGPAGTYFATMPVVDHAFSTAGDYERAFVAKGRRYHHIIDPRTGYPATASRSVTIWAKDALTADALDDAVFILGPEKGLALVESIEDAGAVIVDDKNQVHVSARLAGKVRVEHPPTDGI
jgi:thiamine biosynthesis lipoprotein